MGMRWPKSEKNQDRSARGPRGGTASAANGRRPVCPNTSTPLPEPATAPRGGQGVTQLTVGAGGAGQRLDNFLFARYRTLPRSLVYRWLRTGAVRVNRHRARPTARLNEGDTVRVPPVQDLPAQAAPVRPSSALAGALEAAVVHEDAALLVIDKPAGLASHGGSGLSLGLIEALRAVRPELKELELVHRLDRDTSGCLVLAKRRSALRALHEALREGRFDKRYLVLLTGKLAAPREVRATLRRSVRGGERLMTVADDGQQAHTTLRPLERLGGYTLAEAQPHTGRMHQIRVHAASVGMPVAGDRRYGGDAPVPPGLRRLFLHAHTLAFPQPGGESIERFSAPLPEDLEAVLRALRAPGRTSAPV